MVSALIKNSVVISVLFVISPITMAAETACEYKLFFGLSIPSGNAVSSEEWERFVAETIVTELKIAQYDGFNISNAKGYWKGKPEDSRILSIVSSNHCENEKNQPLLAALQKIAQKYKTNYKQDSVGFSSTLLYEASFNNEWLDEPRYNHKNLIELFYKSKQGFSQNNSVE